MIRITETQQPLDRFSSIPIQGGKPMNTPSPGQHPPRRPRRSFHRPRFRRIAAVVLWFSLFLALGSPLLVPFLTTTLLAKYLTATLNRPTTIARAEFNPLTFTLTLHQLIIGPKFSKPDDPVDPLLSAGSLAIDFEPKRLPDGEIAYNLEAKHFFLHLLRQKDGSYNLARVMNDLLPQGKPLLPLHFSCNTLTISNSRLIFDDEQTAQKYLAEEITLTIPQPDTSGKLTSFPIQAKINGALITLNDDANQPPNPAQEQQLLSVVPVPAEPGPTGLTPAETAANTAKTLVLLQNFSQTAGKYLHFPGNQPVAQRSKTPLTP